MFLRILIGIIMCVVGFFMVKKPDAALRAIGQVDFAEKFFSGGSYTFFQIFGVVLILLGFSIILNLHLLLLGKFYNLFF